MKDLKSRLRKKDIVFGSWITIGHTAVAEIMAKSGFDWLAIDMEHSAITLDLAQQLIQVIGLCGVSPLVRVGENDPVLIKRVMDAGAHGVIVPMVNSADEARRAVSSVKYPPLGKRGVGLARAQGYGMEFDRYKKWVNEKSIVIVQVEHIDAVENLDDILNVKDVDGFIVGPYDLSASLGVPGEFDNPEVVKAMRKVLSTAGHYNISPGFHVIPPEEQAVLKKIREGYRFIGFSLDTLFMGVNCSEKLAILKNRKKA